jgi:abhydrolase domain-containing protein 12
MSLVATLKPVAYALSISTGVYVLFIGLLTIPFFQDQAIYLHGITLTWFQDVTVPEQWGFLHNQVTPFALSTPDKETLHAWHVLPLGIYQRYEEQLLAEPAGITEDIKSRLGFQHLRDDPSSLLVIYLHGAAGTLGSGWRPPSYRAMSAAAPDKIHTVAIDYRGFGSSSGAPSEEGLLTDALTLVNWAIDEAGIPSSRIVLFSQSIGTAVAISLAHHMVNKPEPVLFRGMVLVAPFADVERLTATYRIAGVVPILGPVAGFPRLLAFLNTFIKSKWLNRDKLGGFIQRCGEIPGASPKYDITIIHAEDDYDIPWTHSEQVFWHAVNSSVPDGVAPDELETAKATTKSDRGAGGWAFEWKTTKGVIREAITKYGLHDRIMSYPVVSLAVWRAFQSEVE